MSQSPYAGQAEGPAWLTITQGLIAEHPFGATDPQNLVGLRESCLAAWNLVWQTTVGVPPLSVRLTELDVPATVIGYFFEILLARELAAKYPQTWRGNQSKEEKDLVCLTDAANLSLRNHSVEIKTSGQLGFKVYGNRSHGQNAEKESLVKKEKSGYYLTVNFYGQTLTLLRFGWVDAEDWAPQKAPTGQMAGLKPSVYKYKLVEIPGSYRRSGPIRLLEGVGEKTAEELSKAEVTTIGDMIDKQAALTGKVGRMATAVVSKNQAFLAKCGDPPGTPSK